MLNRRPLLLSISSIAASLLPRAPAYAIYSWRIATEYMASSMPGEGVTFFANAATAGSGGFLAVVPAYEAPDGLVSAAMPKAVAGRQVEAADAFTGFLSGLAPIFELSALPFVTTSSADAHRLLAISRPAYVRALGDMGLTLLYGTPWPATGLWSRKPVPNVAALKGLRTRTYDAASTTLMRKAGADARKISYTDMLTLLQSGDLDAALSSGDGGLAGGLWQHLPYFTKLNYASPLSLAFCGGETLAALPDIARTAIVNAAAKTEAHQFATIVARTADNENKLRAKGTTIVEAPELRAALASAATPIAMNWAARAGAEGGAILGRFWR